MESFIKGLAGFNRYSSELFIIVMAFLAWWLAGRKMAIFSLLGLFFIYNVQLWEVTMETLSMVIASVLLCAVVGIPLGIFFQAKPNGSSIDFAGFGLYADIAGFCIFIACNPLFRVGRRSGGPYYYNLCHAPGDKAYRSWPETGSGRIDRTGQIVWFHLFSDVV